ncbi:MAG TPA: ATP-binding protein, partial [Phytomonospora sp.]
DDGRGFAAAGPAGFGLTAMRQRATSLGGDVQVESSPGNGTAVSVSIPLTGAAR